MKKNVDPKKVEKQLIPRLKAMGYILLVFAVITLGYRFTLSTSQEPQFELFNDEEAAAGFSFLDEDEEALLPTNPQIYYLFASLFVAVGLICISVARRKATKLAIEEIEE